MLWENEFYEDGVAIAERITALAEQVDVNALARLCVEARTKQHLRHVPLLLLTVLARRGSGSSLVSNTIAATIERADELSEFLAIYAKAVGASPKELKSSLTAQVKRGVAKAFPKFDAYQLAKYDRQTVVRLRDALFLCHPKPENDEQAALWKALAEGKLPTPDTWETALSGGADKKGTFERLLRDGRLGYLALLRNLRNMEQAGVDGFLVRSAIAARRGADRVLPFRYVAAARACPKMEGPLDDAMLASLTNRPKLTGKTLVLVDTSGSMQAHLSQKSDLTRLDAACALGAIAKELCDDATVYATAGDDWKRKHATAEVPGRRGMALIDATRNMEDRIGHGGIFLRQVMEYVREREKTADRIIVITDEQDCGLDKPADVVPFGTRANYLINVASAKNGIGYGPHWRHIDGFSERVFDYMLANESNNEVRAA